MTFIRHQIAVLALIFLASPPARAATPGGDIEVPFEFVRDSIIVQVEIDGHGPFDMLLDTGVDPSIIDIATARSIRLKVASKGGQGSGGGSDVNLAFPTSLHRVALGDLRARDVAALATDLSKTAKALGRPIAGVLGYSLLANRIVQFDYPHRVARFLRRPPPPTAHVVVVSFRYRDEILIDDVSINGTKVVANLDTGSNAGFQIPPAAVDALGLARDAAAGEALVSTGINGRGEHHRGTVRNIAIDRLSIDGPEVVFLGKGTGHDGEKWGVRIGNEFLKDYVVTVDYRHRRITFDKP